MNVPMFPQRTRLRVISNFGNGDWEAGKIHTHARAKALSPFALRLLKILRALVLHLFWKNFILTYKNLNCYFFLSESMPVRKWQNIKFTILLCQLSYIFIHQLFYIRVILSYIYVKTISSVSVIFAISSDLLYVSNKSLFHTWSG